jgi:hypothetical protein
MGQTVTPLPTLGDIVVGRDVAGRILRISSHPEADRMVLSIWQEGRCLATVRLARSDIPAVTHALVEGLVPCEQPVREPATVTPLRAEPPAGLRSAAIRVTEALTQRLRRR